MTAPQSPFSEVAGRRSAPVSTMGAGAARAAWAARSAAQMTAKLGLRVLCAAGFAIGQSDICIIGTPHQPTKGSGPRHFWFMRAAIEFGVAIISPADDAVHPIGSENIPAEKQRGRALQPILLLFERLSRAPAAYWPRYSTCA